MRLKNLFFISLLTIYFINAQSGILLNTNEATESYTLFENQYETYLIDNCGVIVNNWDIRNTNNHSKLLPNGHLIFIKNNTVWEYDWDGNLVKNITHFDDELSIVYEVILMPSGNYLCLGRRAFSQEEFEGIGYNYGFNTTPNVVDVVVELDSETGAIVWEWNISDHVIQQRDSSLPNYGVLSDHPELLNMDAISGYDWTFYESFMINGFDYNPTLDHIVLSVRKIGEIAIIDHSTTTQEAAGSTGGNSGKGGDILYRWGNPENYGRGTQEDRYLYFQHNPNWITEGEQAGKIICYNNRLGVPGEDFDSLYSSIPIIDPPIDQNGIYLLEDGMAYGPASPTLRYNRLTTNSLFYSSYTSGAEHLPNGNIYITEGQSGRLLELNPEGETVWTYSIPSSGYIFRSEKYPIDYEAFTDKDLTPIGQLPGVNSSYDCMLMTRSEDLPLTQRQLLAKYSAAFGQIEMKNKAGAGFQYKLFTIDGRTILKGGSQFYSANINVSFLQTGTYLLSMTDTNLKQIKTHKITIR